MVLLCGYLDVLGFKEVAMWLLRCCRWFSWCCYVVTRVF